jgi:hypothetical protein
MALKFYARECTILLSSRGSRMSQRRIIVIGTVLVIALIAFVPVLLRGADVGEPAGLGSPSPPVGSPSPTPTPLPTGPQPPATPSPDPPAPGEPSPTDDDARPMGRAAITDAEGDVVDTAGETAPGPAEAVDLLAVTLESDGEELEVTFMLAGSVPEGSEHSLLWSVDLFVEEEPRYSITVQQVGTRRVAGVLDWETLEQPAPPDPPEVEDETVRLRVPLELLADLPSSFTWQALGQLDGGYEDRAPDDDRATFPDA